MKRENLDDKVKDIIYDMGFDITEYLNSKVLNLETNQPDFFNLQGTTNRPNKQQYDSGNVLSSSINRREFDTGLDAKFRHRKKREGD